MPLIVARLRPLHTSEVHGVGLVRLGPYAERVGYAEPLPSAAIGGRLCGAGLRIPARRARLTRKRDRATRLLGFIGEVCVNGNPDMKGRRAVETAGSPPPVPRSGRDWPG